MARWTRSVIRHRRPIIACWLVLFVVGGAAAANLGDLLSNRFSVPGSDSERGLDLLKDKRNPAPLSQEARDNLFGSKQFAR